MAIRNPDRFVRGNGSGVPTTTIQDGDGDQLAINPDGSINVSGVTIDGPVTVSSEVEVRNDSGNPVPISGTVTANLGTIDGAATESTLTAIEGLLEGLPNVSFAQVVVTGTEIAVPASNLANRKTISVKALIANGAAVYLGETGVTTTTGYELSPGDSIEIDADATVLLFAVSASGSQRVSIVEVA